MTLRKKSNDQTLICIDHVDPNNILKCSSFYRFLVACVHPTWQQFANATATATAQAAGQQRRTQRLQVEPGRESMGNDGRLGA